VEKFQVTLIPLLALFSSAVVSYISYLFIAIRLRINIMTHDTVHVDYAEISSQCPDSTDFSQHKQPSQHTDTAHTLPFTIMTLLTCLIV